MSKQDRQPVRTAVDIERKYGFGKSFAEVMGIAEDARAVANEAKESSSKPAEKLTHEEIFNLLTKNGTIQGLYRGEDGELYINASYIVTGEFLADLIKAGVIKSKDEGVVIDLDNGVGNLARGQAAWVTEWDDETAGFTKSIDDAIREFLTAELDKMQEDTIKDFAAKVGTANTTSHAPGVELSLHKLRNPAGHLQASASFEWSDGAISHMSAIEDYVNGNPVWVWGEMAWENPPMELGVEYRTTDRFMGNPVYTKLIDCGVPTDDVYVSTGLTSGNVIRFTGCMGGVPLPLHYSGNKEAYNVNINVPDVTAVNIQVGSSATPAQTYCQLWYTHSVV